MDPFLSRFYTAVDDYLGDPHTSARFPNASKLLAFNVAERRIFEDLLRISGQESYLGRAETTISLVADRNHYHFPPAFRQFWKLEYREDGDPDLVTNALPTIGEWSPGPGIIIVDANRGFIVRPVPDTDETWYLVYQKGPIEIHYGTVTASTNITNTGTQATLKVAASPTAGTVSTRDDYYNGSLLHIVSATAGEGQILEVTDYVALTGVLTLRHLFDTTPTGTVVYEIMPTVPPQYDDIYAIDVALEKARIRRSGNVGNLLQARKDLWKAVTNFFTSNLADRLPETNPVQSLSEPDPYYL
jgi:hypothetical protein